MRTADIQRTTNETDVSVWIELDGSGRGDIDTGMGFMNHMLELFARHGRFDLDVKCVGDTHVDYHHSTEDIGITLGAAVKDALGEKRGIRRYGSIMLPMDEALVLCAVDLSGRAHLEWDAEMPQAKVGDFDTELVKEFFLGFVRASEATVHIREISGENTHHIIEAMFKGFSRALAEAASPDPALRSEIPSTKGVL